MEKYCHWPRKKKGLRQTRKKEIDWPDFWKKTKRLMILAVILSLAYTVFFLDFFEVKKMEISGNLKLSIGEIEDFVFSEINRVKTHPSIKGDMVLLDSEQLKKALLKKFKIIKSVEIKKIFPDTLKISIAEKSIATVWCRVSCYWLDEEGVVFEPLSKKRTGTAELKNITMVLDDENLPAKEGDKIVDGNFLDFANSIRKALKDELALDFDNIKTPGVITGEIWVQTRQNWRILFNARGNAEEEVRLLKQILKEKITAEEMKKLEYIDLRINGKVFYKIRD